MMRLVDTAMIAIVLAASFAPMAAAAASTPASDATEAAIRRVNHEEVEAFLHDDRAALARLWSPDLVVTNPLNQLVRKDAVLNLIASGFLAITAYDRRVEYIRTYGEIAIVAGAETVTWGGRMPLAGKAQELRFTAVWRLDNGNWREIARDANIVR